jgi:hypothetical protein
MCSHCGNLFQSEKKELAICKSSSSEMKGFELFDQVLQASKAFKEFHPLFVWKIHFKFVPW